MIKFSLAYNFRKNVFIGQNLKRIHVTCSFDEKVTSEAECLGYHSVHSGKRLKK